MTRSILSCALVLLFSTAAFAETSFQFNMPGVQAPKDPDVNGMRLVLLYGKNKSVSGLDLGLAAFSESGTQSGASINFGVSKVTGPSSGCKCSLVNIHEGKDTGANVAFINIISSADKAVNFGFVNMTQGTSKIDFGGLSMSKESDFQFGFVNVTGKINRLQLGFLNVADNGFFKVFPFFNIPKD